MALTFYKLVILTFRKLFLLMKTSS